ncbi:DUF3617 domain-containing protein [Dyella agri]|uniref:DUF3617 family protein n=1 Tax=Dyella agri TaxID=1926869 RepID=A0ABW8KF83_9GAMM
MKLPILLPFGAGLVLVAVCATCFAQKMDGKLIEVSQTVTIQMQSMAVPPQTMSRKICTAPDKFDPQALLQEGSDCSISDYRENGSTITFHVACTSPHLVAAEGVLHRHADGGIDGSMHAAMTAVGRPVAVETTYQGRPVGSCDYKPAG